MFDEPVGAIQLQITKAEGGGYVISAAFLGGMPQLFVAKSMDEMAQICRELFEPKHPIPHAFKDAWADEDEVDEETMQEILKAMEEEDEDDEDDNHPFMRWLLF